jgi:phosphatidylinositol alpha-1,6-mannosyltransferase
MNVEGALHVFISENVPPTWGGVARVAFSLSHALAEAGYQTVLCGFDHYLSDPLYQQERFAVIPISSRAWKQLRDITLARLLWQLWRKNRDREVVIYALTWKLARVASFIAKRLGWRLVVFAHGTEATRELSATKRRSMMHVFQRADLCLAVSGYTADFLTGAGVAANKVHVLHNAVDTHAYYPVSRAQDLEAVRTLRHKLGCDEALMVLTLARVIERKGQDSVIEALGRLIQQKRIRAHQVRYVVAGRGPDTELQRLRTLTERLGLNEVVLFWGYVAADDMLTFYNACDVYVMNSRAVGQGKDIEGFGITLIEAGACGKPVIGGRSGGVVDAVSDGRSGFLVDPTNIDELADRLAQLLNDEPLRAAMGAEGLRRAREELNIYAAGERLVGLLRAQLAGDS